MPIVVIDPGHGGSNEGAKYGNNIEKYINMKVATSMKAELEKFDGVTVYLTHDNPELDLSLKDRATIANNYKADFLVSLHFNAKNNHEFFGSEVWIPANGDLNRASYQFATIEEKQLETLGIYSRGVKTKLNDQGLDYYGILQHTAAYGIPCAIVEHAHMDNAADLQFMDSDADLYLLGTADALSIAQYFGLSSSSTGVSYANTNAKANLDSSKTYANHDTTKPESCTIRVASYDSSTGLLKVEITAVDKESPILYFSFSLDGGNTFTEVSKWPEANAISGTYPETVTATVQTTPGKEPNLMARVYNQYDNSADSNILTSYEVTAKKNISSSTTSEKKEKEATEPSIIKQLKEAKEKKAAEEAAQNSAEESVANSYSIIYDYTNTTGMDKDVPSDTEIIEPTEMENTANTVVASTRNTTPSTALSAGLIVGLGVLLTLGICLSMIYSYKNKKKRRRR